MPHRTAAFLTRYGDDGRPGRFALSLRDCEKPTMRRCNGCARLQQELEYPWHSRPGEPYCARILMGQEYESYALFSALGSCRAILRLNR